MTDPVAFSLNQAAGFAILWKRLCELCEKQGLDPKNLPAGFYETAADCLDVDEAALKRLVMNATTARRTISLNDDKETAFCQSCATEI